MSDGPLVFITLAEASADQHAAHMIAKLRELSPDVRIEGIGGEKMRSAGAIIHHESVSRAAMGWRAALRAREVAEWLRWTREYYAKNKPALHICCDSWSMNWRFARLAHEQGIPVLYYIAPQTWASREGRIAKLRRYVTKLACILPFEEQYFRQHGVDATYVGHPLFDELASERGASKSSEHFPTIGILPGSRASIAGHNFPHQLEVARRIQTVFSNAKFLIPTTPVTHNIVSKIANEFATSSGTPASSEPGRTAEGVSEDSSAFNVPRSAFTIDLNGFDRVVPQCDFCITVSGTAALHIAAYAVPFVVVYRVNPWHWHLVGRWVVKTRTYSLVNILSGRDEHIVPEFIPWYGSERIVADKVIDYLQHPEKMVDQKRQLAAMLRPIDRPGASMNVARMAAELL